MIRFYRLQSLFTFVFIFIVHQSQGANCPCETVGLKEILEKHKDSSYRERDLIYMRATVLASNPYLQPQADHAAFNIKVHEYWSPRPLHFKTDTLAILSETTDCALRLHKQADYLLVLRLQSGIFTNRECSGSALLSSYKKDIALLGTSRTLHAVKAKPANPARTKPKRTEKERRRQLVIWLVVSLSLNIFAIMLMVILKKEKV